MERVLQVLIERGNPSTKEIEDLAQVASARDYIRRLRDKGYKIETVEEGVNHNGARIVRYVIQPRAFEIVQKALFGSGPGETA